MSKNHPYVPKGHCAECKFSAPIPKDHWQREYNPLFCHRVPPTPGNRQDIWSQIPHVQNHSFCAMFEAAEPKAPDQLRLDSEFFRHSNWDCAESPTKKCVYTHYSYEDCIFCGHPEERK